MKLNTRLALLTALTGLAAGAHAQAPGPDAPAAPKTQLAFVTNNASDYWTICRKGTEAAAKALGNVDVQFVMPDDGTAATQKQDVDDLLAKGVQGIAVSPVDPANETRVPERRRRRRPTWSRRTVTRRPASRLCYIGTDNHAAGVMAGRLIKKGAAAAAARSWCLSASGRRPECPRAHRRHPRTLCAAPASPILGVKTDDTDHARARQNVVDTLAQYPHIAGLVGIWSYNGPAILSAVSRAGRAGKVRVIAFDEQDRDAGRHPRAA